MKFSSIFSALLIAVASTTTAQNPASSSASSPMRAKLDALPDNTWLNLELPWKGGNEVPAVFDEANGLYFKYAGCGDRTEVINRPTDTTGLTRAQIDGGGYGNSSWAVDRNTLEWKLIRPYDASWPKDRPGNGCSRSYVYDTKRKVIWLYGGISNGGGGGDHFDLWHFDSAKDVFTKMNATTSGPVRRGDAAPGDVIAYDSKHDVVLMPWGDKAANSSNSMRVYDPTKNAWEIIPAAGDTPPLTGHYASLVFDPVAGVLVYPAATPTGKESEIKGEDTDSTIWRRSRKNRNLYQEYSMATWTYDYATKKWTKIADGLTSPAPSPRFRFGLTYDSRNKVVVLVGGSTDTWDKSEKNYNDVWVLDTAKGKWTPANSQGGPERLVRECRTAAYSAKDNVIFFLNNRAGVWAYRYKN